MRLEKYFFLLAHYDPYHNLLSQVVGQKYIRLYSPIYSENLYPYNEKMLFNTSQVMYINYNKIIIYFKGRYWKS